MIVSDFFTMDDSYISIESVRAWGLLKPIGRNIIIDQHISNISSPIENQLDKILEGWRKRNKIKSNRDLLDWQQMNLLTNQEWKILVIKYWKWESWCLKNFKSSITNKFLSTKDLFDQMTYSLIRTKQKTFLDELYLRIEDDNQDFGSLSSKFSEGPEKWNNGIIGPIEKSKIHPSILSLLLNTNRGKICTPTKVEEWWILVRLDSIKSAILTETIKKKIALELGENYINKILEQKYLII